MKRKHIIILLVLFVGLMWLSTLTGSKDEKAEYIANLKTTAEANEKVGLYKPNEKIYFELISYENDIKWYKKLKEVYNQLGKTSKYEDMCEEIFLNFPDDEENTLELIRIYDEDERSSQIMKLYNESLSDKFKNHDEIKKIYYKYACEAEFVTSYFQGWENSWSEYMLVKEDEKYRFLYSNGTYTFDKVFDYADYFFEDYAAVKDEHEWMFIDKEGDKYINCSQEYEEVHSYCEGYAVVKKNGKYGYIDMQGNEYDIKYAQASTMYNGVAAVKDGESWYLINSSLEKINDKKYEDIILNSVDVCSRSGIIFAKKDGKYIMLDLKGEQISNVTFEDAKLFTSDGLAAVKNNGKWGFVDKTGKKIIDYQYEDADSFSCGFAPVKVEGKYEYISTDGVIRTDCKFEYATQLNGVGYGVVQDEEGYQVITFPLCNVN